VRRGFLMAAIRSPLKSPVWTTWGEASVCIHKWNIGRRKEGRKP
jgi:hypothetical protein